MARLADDVIQDEVSRLQGWVYADGALHRAFTFPTFMGSIEFVNQIARLAEDAGHHPDITILYNRVTLTLATHDQGGVTERDIELARRIDALAGE